MENKTIMALAVVALVVIGLVSFGLGRAGMVSEEVLNSKLSEQQTALNERLEQTTAQFQQSLEQAQATAEQARLDAEAAKQELETRPSQEAIDEANQRIIELEQELLVENTTQEDEETVVINEDAYVIDEIKLDGDFGTTLDDRDLVTLFDGEITYDGEDYDVQETIALTGNVRVLTSQDDTEFGSEPVVGFTDTNSVQYMYTFEDGVELVDGEELVINFLGRELTVVSANPANEEVELLLADEYFLTIDEEITVDGNTVRLIGVGDEKALLEVNGKIISVEEDELERESGLEIFAKNVFEDTINNKGYAVIQVGEDTRKTIGDGDEFENDDRYDWVVVFDGDELTTLGVMYQDVENDPDEAVLRVGDKYELPYGFASLTFAGYTEEYEYNTLDLRVRSDSVEFAYDVDAVLIAGEEIDDGEFEFDGTTVTYELDGDDMTASIEDVVFEIEDREVTMAYTDSVLVFSNGIELVFDFEEKEFTSVKYDGDSLMNVEDDYLTIYGDIITGDIGDRAEDGEFTISLVEEEVTVDVIVA